MSAEPAPLSPTLPAPLVPARLGRPERIALALLAVLATLLLAAWQIPPRLDWSRYRGTIATYASTRLGRPVAIAGQVRLTLLPRPMLLAGGVTLADRGDGVSAQLGTLRLEVALPSLLAFRIVPRALALDDPTATLPWPPPRGTTPPLPARASRAFSATVNGGTLIVGGITLRDITGSLRTDPDTGAFSADGDARVAGLPWRFTALLGAPGADGVSPISLTLDGRPDPQSASDQSAPSPQSSPDRTPAPDASSAPDMRGTGGAFHGRLLADGSLAGTLVLRGPDLSRLGGGPPLPWHIEGAISGQVPGTVSEPISSGVSGPVSRPVPSDVSGPISGDVSAHVSVPQSGPVLRDRSGDGLTLRAPALDLRLADSPGRADLTLHLDPPAALSLHASIGQLQAGAWMIRLLQRAAHPVIAADIDLTASALQTPRALLPSPYLHIVLGPEGASVPAASIILPGGTRLAASGAISRAGGRATGQLDMQAPALHDTLDWLAGGTLHLPASVLARADLHGAFTAEPSRLSWSGLTGRIDGSPVTGSLATTLPTIPATTLHETPATTVRTTPAVTLPTTPAITLTAGPAIAIELSTPRLPLSGWDWPPARATPSLASLRAPRLPAPLDVVNLTLRLAADQVDWPGLPLRHAVLNVESGPAGITLHELALDLPGEPAASDHAETPASPRGPGRAEAQRPFAAPGLPETQDPFAASGHSSAPSHAEAPAHAEASSHAEASGHTEASAHFEASGHLARDGTLTDGRADLAAADAATLPAAWRLPARLWQGGFHLALKGAGPPRAIAVALRADLGDLRAEAEGQLDATTPTLEATATLRHPGTPFLLDSLGLADTRAWLDDGAFAMLAHLAISPGRLRARDFSISAGALQIGGALDARLTPRGLQLSGDLDAPTLALPGLAGISRPPPAPSPSPVHSPSPSPWPAPSPEPWDWAWLRALQAHIGVKAERILSGLTPIATAATATLQAGNGVAIISDGRAQLPHGQLEGALAIDATQDPPAFAVLGTSTGLAPETLLPDPPSPPGLALRGGLMDVSADIHGRGYSPAAWLAASAGTLGIELHGASLIGLDLAAAPAAAAATTAPGLHARPAHVMTDGVTAPLDGRIEATIADGVASLSHGRLTGPAGTVELAGMVDAVAQSLTLRVLAAPAGEPQHIEIGLNGPWSAARAIPDPVAAQGSSKAARKRGRARRVGK